MTLDLYVASDYDGIIHSSFDVCLDAVNFNLENKYGVDRVTADVLKKAFANDWTMLAELIGIPEGFRDMHKADYDETRGKLANGEIVDGSLEMIMALNEMTGKKVPVITNATEYELGDIIDPFEDYIEGIHHVYSNKTETLKEVGPTHYIGDTVGDGVASLEAGVRFVGVAHDHGYNLPEALYEFQAENLGEDIVIVESVRDVPEVLSQG